MVQDVYDDGVDQEAPSAVYWPVVLDHFEGDKQTVWRDLDGAPVQNRRP